MSKSRLSRSSSKPRRSTRIRVKKQKNKTATKKKFIGISLSGGKADKACLAILEYFPLQDRIFLSRLVERVSTEELISADLKIHKILMQNTDELEMVAFDAPLSLPTCVTCRLACPGFEVCKVPQVRWIRDFEDQKNKRLKKPKPRKMMTPYTQRCVDTLLAQVEEENLEVQHALGANLAPLTGRAIFIRRRLKVHAIEVLSKLSVWRIGQELKVNRSQLRSYRNSVGGEEARGVFLQALVEKSKLFLYQQDIRSLVENSHAFDAFIAAFTAFFKSLGKTEAPPKGFPQGEAWVEFPVKNSTFFNQMK